MADKKIPLVRDITDAQDAEIRRQIADDPDTWEIPPGAPVLRRGRRPGRTKMQVTVSLDIDLVEALKAVDEKGWQTRLNAAARAGLGI